MKRFIALVLSLIMALSLCAPAWGMMPVGGDAEDTAKPALPVAKMTPLGSDYEIDTTGSKLGADFGVFALDTAYQFEPTESVEEAQASYYRYWHADFVVYSDKDVPDGSMALAGYYDAWCSLNNYKWVALTNEGLPIGANEEVRLVYGMGNGGISVNYEELCNYGNDGTGFQCGVADITGENAGSTITVELRLYETEEPSDANGNSHNVETGNYEIIGTYSYTFGPVAMIGDAEYDTLQEAVDAAENGDVITVKANNLTATVNTSKFFTVEYDDVTKAATITAADGYKVIENNGVYTVMKTYKVTFDANGGTNEYTLAPVVEGKLVLPENPFTAPAGKQFKAWSVNGVEYAEGAEIDVAADVTVVAVWEYLPAVTEPEVDVAPPVVSAGTGVDTKNETVSNVVETISKGGVEIDDTAIAAAAQEAADENKVVPTKAQAEKLNELPSISGATVDDVAIVVQTYYDVEIKEVTVDEDTDKTASITVDITPMQQTVATTEDVVKGEDDIEVGTNAVKVGDPVPVKITEPVEITLKLPSSCFEVGQKVYITHKASNGTVIYEAVVAADYTITFKTTHGFSPFTISATAADVKASVGTDNYADLQSAVNYMGKDATVIVKASDQFATVSFATTFTVKFENGATKDNTKITASGNAYLAKTTENNDGTVTYEFKTYTGWGGGLGGSTSTTDKPVKSADTFDAGIALYVGMSIVAAAGSAVVIGKKKEF